MAFEQQKALDDAYIMHTYGRLPVEFVAGSGMTLTDDAGKTYLDFLAGIGVCSLGHAHPAVTRAIASQAEKLTSISNYFYTEHRGEVAALLSKLANNDIEGARALVEALDAGDVARFAAAAAPAPGEQVWKTFFANSGAEANEGSMKLARLYARRQGNGGNTIVCLKGGFHGRTLETIAATMQDWLQESFTPLPGGFVACAPNDIDELTAIFEKYGKEICAFMFEPIQGESGVHPLTEEFARKAEELVHQVGGLTISDEVQAGVFRCGVPFAVQMLGNGGTQLHAVIAENRLIRGVDIKGHLAAVRQKAHINSPVNQLVGHGYLVFSPAVISRKQRLAVRVFAVQPYHFSLPVQLYLHFRVNG